MTRRGFPDPAALPPRLRDSNPVRWLTPVLTLLAGLVSAEVALRVFQSESSGCFIHRPLLNLTVVPFPGAMPGVEGESEFKVNSLGLRGPEPPSGERRCILMLGGGLVECRRLDQEEAWPALLEKELNADSPQPPVWVANAGLTGTSSREHRLQTPILLDDLPRVDLLILVAGVDDLLLRLALDDRYDPDFVVKPGSNEFLLHRAFEIAPSTAESRTFRLMPHRLLGWIGKWTGLPSTMGNGFEPLHRVEKNAGESDVRRRHYRWNRPATREELPDLSTGLWEFEKNLEDCLKAARSRKVRVLLVSHPALWDENLTENLESLLWMGGVGSISGEGIEYYSASVLARALRQYNDRIRSLAESQGVDFFDLADHLPRDDSVFYDDCHLNEAGAVQAAKLLAEAVRSMERKEIRPTR